MATNGKFGVLAILGVIAVGVKAGLFSYSPKPIDHSLVRQALTSLGIDPEGITIKSLYEKDWALGQSYKATYLDQEGNLCHIQFSWRRLFGLYVKGTPSCDPRHIGAEYS